MTSTHSALPTEIQAILARVAIDGGMSLEQHRIAARDERNRITGNTVEMMVLQHPPCSAPELAAPKHLGESVRIAVTMVSVNGKPPRFRTTIQSDAVYKRNLARANDTMGSTSPSNMISDTSVDTNAVQLKRTLAGLLGAEKSNRLTYAARGLKDELLIGSPALAPLTPDEIKAVVFRRFGYGNA